MESTLQMAVVLLLVPACAAYAAWKLIPSAARRSLASAALRWPAWPQTWRARVERAAQPSTGACGCDGCDHRPDRRPGLSGSKAPAAPAVEQLVAQPIVLHRRIASR